ncbi:unnamed protein product [Kluyveromyces dobzhanskii CBS 2104]|uniref:WGS project CCBQ000000000 data, contig 00010 n=1 Tax=Kluyveromyces dobzhanskii CBS 2104 TaxID=1427455 RepID=A0A0A8LCQ2_9SACH|nr:unnamed protein product [Kluyveromyces dobzhanskii CBS 2104]
MERHTNERNRSLKMKHKHNRKDKQRHHNGLAQKQQSSENGLSAGRSIKSGVQGNITGRKDNHIPTLSFVRQTKDRNMIATSTPRSNTMSSGSHVNKNSEPASFKFRRSSHPSKEREVNEGHRGFQQPSRLPVASASPARPLSARERDSTRKIGYSHTEMLKSLYVGDKKSPTVTERTPSDNSPTSNSTERQSVRHSLPKSFSKSDTPTSGRVHKSTATPFQRHSRPINKIIGNTNSVTPSAIKFAFETTLNEVDLNLLTRARASSGGHPTSNGSTNDPVVTTKKNKAEVQNKAANVVQSVNKPTSSNPTTANDDKTHVPKIADDIKELSDMLSSRLTMRDVLFAKNKTPEVEIEDLDTQKDRFIEKKQQQPGSVSTSARRKTKNNKSMNLPSMQSIITDSGRLARRKENSQTSSGISKKSATSTKNQSKPRDLLEISEAKKKTTKPIAERLEKTIPQLDLTSPSPVRAQATKKKSGEMAATPVVSVISATSVASATKDSNDHISKSTEKRPTLQKTDEEATDHYEINAHGEPTLKLTEANISKITKKDDVELQSKPNTFAHLKEQILTEEATLFVASSDSSSEKSSDGSSSGQHVGDFQLLNSAKTRMVGPKVGKWRIISKSKLIDLMNYLVFEHTAIADRDGVSCSNDICNTRNYEQVEISNLQKLPPRLQYLDLQSETNGNVTKPVKADRRVENLRKNELFNGSVQKRRTRASAIDSEGGKKILQEQQIEDRVPRFNFDAIPQETILSTPSKVRNYKPSKTTQDVNTLPRLISSPGNSKCAENSVHDNAVIAEEMNTQVESPEAITQDTKDVGENTLESLKSSTMNNNLGDTTAEPSQLIQPPTNIEFDPEKCEDLAQFRIEYLKLRALNSEESPFTSNLSLTSAMQECADQKEVIENLADVIIKSELKIASLVGMNNELQQKINEMESIQTKLIHELSQVPIESPQYLHGKRLEVSNITERKGREISIKKQPVEETSPSAHRKLVNKVEKDLVEIEELNKVVTERLAEIKAIKDSSVEDHPLIQRLKDTLEAERARSKAQLSLEKQRVANLKAALLSKNGKIDIGDYLGPAISSHGGTIEELNIELLRTREYARTQQKANKNLQLQCASYQRELSEAAIKSKELSSKVFLATEQCGQLNVVNNRLITKLKRLEEQNSTITCVSPADKIEDAPIDSQTQENARRKQHLHKQNNQAQIPKPTGESQEKNEGIIKLSKEDLKKLSNKISSLQHELKVLKQLESKIVPLSTFCRQENLSIRNVIDRLQWVKELELTIFTMFNEKKMLTAKLKELEGILNKNDQTIRHYEDSRVNLEKTNEIQSTSEDSVDLEGIVIRLLEEREKLKSTLQDLTEQKDHVEV